MSDKDNDTEIIRHDAPHQVTMKEGSHMAVGKKPKRLSPRCAKSWRLKKD